jgi:hypothetical protein
MKVSELIEALQTLPNQDAEVIIARDPEGNGFHKFEDISEGTVRPEELEVYFIESFYSDQHTDDDCCLDPGERDNFPKVICLWP